MPESQSNDIVPVCQALEGGFGCALLASEIPAFA